MAVSYRSPPRRIIRAGSITRKEVVERDTDLVAERHIRNHPQHEIILASLREGIACSEIARYFAQEQWITVSEKTFLEYIYVFRKRCWALVTGQNKEDVEQGIQRFVGGHRPELDIDTELDRSIRFQQLRLGIGHKREQELGMPLEQVGRDTIGLGKLLELKLKRKGLLSVTNAIQNSNVGSRDELSKVRRDQEDQDKLYEMANQLVGRTRDAAD